MFHFLTQLVIKSPPEVRCLSKTLFRLKYSMHVYFFNAKTKHFHNSPASWGKGAAQSCPATTKRHRITNFFELIFSLVQVFAPFFSCTVINEHKLLESTIYRPGERNLNSLATVQECLWLLILVNSIGHLVLFKIKVGVFRQNLLLLHNTYVIIHYSNKTRATWFIYCRYICMP